MASKAKSNNDERGKRGRKMVDKLTGGYGGKTVKNTLPPKFAEYTMNFVFGELWSGDDLTLKERSLVTCSALIAMNRLNEMKHHFAIAKNLGHKRETLEAIITHLAAYAGWPCAVTANEILNGVWPKKG
jgi:4-carboxymuconolactone decarboxylase